ncbi:unnamed protein product [Closterium sp. NIES-64]|nr:unnamed protein product [Closterium sp. NIES-64]
MDRNLRAAGKEWPPFSPSLHLLAACVLALLAAAVANAGGVGGGGLFVPLFNLLLGYDAKSATALSKAIINPLRSTPSPLPIPLSLPSLHPPGPIYPPPSLSPPNLPIPLRMFAIPHLLPLPTSSQYTPNTHLLPIPISSNTLFLAAMIMGGAIASACFNLPLQHPFHPHLPLIDFRVARLMQPMLLLGISMGITCNVVFPPWLLTAVLTLLLSCMAGKAAQRAVAMMVTEAHMAAVCLHGSYGAHHTTPLSLTIPWLVRSACSLSAAPPGALIATHTLHQQPLPSHAKDQQPGGCCVHAGTCCCHAACEEGYPGSADYGGVESETGKGKRHRTWSAGHVLKPFVFRFACGATARLSACDVECVWEMVAVWSAFVALQVAKTRVAACSAVYWLLDLLQLPVALVATAAVSARRDFAPSLPHSHSHCHQHHSTPPLHTTYAHEHHQPTPTSCSPCQPSTNAPTPSPASSPVSPLLASLSTPGYSTFHSPPPYPPHMQAAWSHGSSIAHTAYTHTRSNSSGSSSSVWGAGAGAWGREVWVYPLSALLAGCMGGLLGVGGGMVMGPVLLELGMLPQVSSATSSFIVLFSSSLSVLEFYLLGRIPIPPALLFSLIAALAALLGLSTIRALVVRSGRTSLIVLFLSLVIAASAVLLGALGVMRIRSDWESGAPMGFRAFCGETW